MVEFDIWQGGDGGVVRFFADCFVRAAPCAGSAILGVARRGSGLPAAGSAANGWLPVWHEGKVGWASGKYAERGDGKGGERLVW